MNFYGNKAKEKRDGAGWGPGNWKLAAMMIGASALLLLMGILFVNVYMKKAENYKKNNRTTPAGNFIPAQTGTTVPITKPPAPEGTTTVK